VSLSSLPTALLIPPLNLVPLGLAGWMLGRRWPRFGRAVAGLALAGLFVLSMPVVGNALLASLEAGLPRDITPPGKKGPDIRPAAIVVLSGDAAYAGPGGLLPDDGIGRLTLERMRAGAILHRLTDLPLLVTGGRLEADAPPIAEQMARALQQDFATPVQWVEPKSIDTWQNAEFSAALLRQSGISAVYLVSDAWHIRRAAIAFRHFGIAVFPAPMRYTRAPLLEADGFVPHMTALASSYFALHEWIGCAWYAWRA
jgi:uncharacterized SAM-binding protein YcdF (DUF218 family)